MAGTTWNPSDLVGITLSNGNLTALASGGGYNNVRSVYQLPAATKAYWELQCLATGAGGFVGVVLNTAALGGAWQNQTNSFWVQRSGGQLYANGANTGFVLGAFGVGDVICLAIDTGASSAWARLNAGGSWNNGSGTPGGSGGLYIGGSLGGLCAGFFGLSGGDQQTANFGGSPFVGTVPDGFLPGLGSDIVIGAAAATARALILA